MSRLPIYRNSYHICLPVLVIIFHPHIARTVSRPTKTNPVLLVYLNTVLAGAITGKSLQTITGWHAEVFQGFC